MIKYMFNADKHSFHVLLVDTPSVPGGRGHVGLRSINEIRILQVLIACCTMYVGVWECGRISGYIDPFRASGFHGIVILVFKC